ncbi:winged helix-turn-helix transcriptional regulator [Hydrocarboniclastica marina]|uniref:Transcriptional regulator n=1 Tax=Hydrocarboniclastica marina TaxID=2259620 RepID=A0A4V1D902_9ALTE|nr:helix-turn-helix domain-containing protein [Hydrocarboniclastica marina]MAL98235.1 transcriptional regulator [Alteromonadaceae bacterium]QCF26980.1 transcriptional regulator [Hydrocarboniclastica marina]|tara:strand:- start:5794 stop:6252 length:459 start_codon:yes stop_codon:yes gene_type:complete
MSRKRFDDSDCSVARALDEVGDWWSLRVVLQAMYGTRRFVDFQSELGIARNILCNRLEKLVENGVLRKEDVGAHGCRFEYRLTDKGRELFPVLVALRQWGDRWTPAPGGSLDLRCRDGLPIAPVAVQDQQGRALDIRQVVLGPREGSPAKAG